MAHGPRTLRAVRLFLLLLMVAPAFAAPRAWTLRLLPTAGSVEYHLTTTDTVSVEAGGRVTTQTTPLTRLVTRRLTLQPGGSLEVEQSDREFSVKLGRGTLALGGARPPAKFRVGPDGRGDGVQLDLVLPPGPVALGARWESTAPASKQVPVALRSAYRLEREETVQGRSCLIIAAEVTGEADGPGGSHLAHRAKARLAFDPRAGLMVRAVSDSRTIVTQPADQRGPRKRTNRVQSRLQLAH